MCECIKLLQSCLIYPLTLVPKCIGSDKLNIRISETPYYAWYQDDSHMKRVDLTK